MIGFILRILYFSKGNKTIKEVLKHVFKRFFFSNIQTKKSRERKKNYGIAKEYQVIS